MIMSAGLLLLISLTRYRYATGKEQSLCISKRRPQPRRDLSSRFITLDDGRKFEIDRLIHRCRAAATKVGGTGIRYTVSICGKQTYLFDEENGKWFVEFKTV